MNSDVKCVLTPFFHLLAAALPEVALSPSEARFSFGTVSAYLFAALIAEKLHTQKSKGVKTVSCPF